MISAIQKAYQPCEMPFPSPEEKYPQRIVIADITKEMEIILSAGMPSSSISELAENNCSNCPGKHQNITVPHKAAIAPAIWPMTVAIAAPRTPIAGQPSRLKIIIGSRIIFKTAPMIRDSIDNTVSPTACNSR